MRGVQTHSDFTIKRINKGLKRKNKVHYFQQYFTIKRINKGLKQFYQI